MDFYKLFCDILPAWLSGIAAVVAIIISCKSNNKSNELQRKIADDNSKLLKDIQHRDANMKLYDLRLEVYMAFMRSLEVEHRIKEFELQLPLAREQAMNAMIEELIQCKIQIDKARNIACFCFSGDAELLSALNKAYAPFIAFCDEILRNLVQAKDMVLPIVIKMIEKNPENAVQIISDVINCNINSQFYQTYKQEISEISHLADNAFADYKSLVSHDKFGIFFEKYLLPEAITVCREKYGN